MRRLVQAVVVVVTNVQLVPSHSQVLCAVEQPKPKSVAKLQRLRIQGDDLILLVVLAVPDHAKKKAAR
jgi:hypothetical protein